MHDLLESHWQAVKRIIYYPKHTISIGLFLNKSSNFVIQCLFTNLDDRQSVGVYYIFMGSNLIFLAMQATTLKCL